MLKYRRRFHFRLGEYSYDNFMVVNISTGTWEDVTLVPDRSDILLTVIHIHATRPARARSIYH